MTDTPEGPEADLPEEIAEVITDRITSVDLQLEMQRSYLDYAMSVIVGRALPDVRDGLKPVHQRVLYAMYDGGYRPDRAVLQVRARRRRRDGQVPPARRHRDLRRPGPAGPALVDAVPAGRPARQLRLPGQRPGRGAAVHRVQDGAAGHGDGPRHRRGDRRLPRQLRRPHPGADRPAGPVPEPAGQRQRRDRGRHGDEHPAAQPARGRRRRPVAPGPPGGGARRSCSRRSSSASTARTSRPAPRSWAGAASRTPTAPGAARSRCAPS